MSDLSNRLKVALDESRMLILGSQVLLGVSYRSVFETRFDDLPASSQTIKLFSLILLLIVSALLMSPGAYHRIVRAGEDTADVHRYATGVMSVALFPFAVALAFDLYVAFGIIGGAVSGVIAGGVTLMLSLFFWYGWELVKRKPGRTMKQDSGETNLHDRIEQVMVECRVVLPGAQALLGFQFITMLSSGFQSLAAASKYTHVCCLALMALSIILLMSPAAYHRLVARGEDTEQVHTFAGRMLLAAMITLPLGICGDFFVVASKMKYSTVAATVGSGLMLSLFYSLWFGYPFYRRHQLDRK